MLKEYLQLPRIVHILCLGMLINRAGSFFVVFLTIYLKDELDLSVRFATLAIGVFGVGSGVGSILGGQLADQIGRKPVMLAALFGSAIMLVGLSFVSNPTLFLHSIFLFAAIVDMYRPAASAMKADIVSPNQRQYAFALSYIAVNLGFAIAPPLGGLLADYSWKLLFWGDAVTTSLFGLVVLMFVPETIPRERQGEATETTTIPIGEAIRRIAVDWPFLFFCGAMLLNQFVFVQSMSTLPLAMLEIGISPSVYGRVIAINGIMIVVLQLPMTRWLSRFDRMLVITVGAALIAIGFGLNLYSTTLAFFAFTIAVWTMGEILQAAFMMAVVTDLAPEELRARYLGAFGLFFAISMAIGAPLGGAIMDLWGTDVLWTLCLWSGLGSTFLLSLLRPSIQARTKVA